MLSLGRPWTVMGFTGHLVRWVAGLVFQPLKDSIMDSVPVTPNVPTPPAIAADPKDLVEPVMVRTLTDSVPPSKKKEDADIDAEVLTTAGQRKINLIWETTQALIAVLVTASTLFVAGSLALKGEGETAAFLLLSNAFFVVISTYLSRTNHQKVGGVKRGDSGR